MKRSSMIFCALMISFMSGAMAEELPSGSVISPARITAAPDTNPNSSYDYGNSKPFPMPAVSFSPPYALTDTFPPAMRPVDTPPASGSTGAGSSGNGRKIPD